MIDYMSAAITLQLDPGTTKLLDEYRQSAGLSREEAVRELLRKHLLATLVRRNGPGFERAARTAGIVSEEKMLA
jgi:hypothetical protein